VTENCVEFNICNATFAKNVLAKLKEFPRLSSFDDIFSPGFIAAARNLTRSIKEEGERSINGAATHRCPSWILKMNLSDALAGSLCSIFESGSGRRSKRDDTCRHQYEELIKKIQQFIQSGSSDLHGQLDLFLEADLLHKTCSPPSDLLDKLRSWLQLATAFGSP